MLSPGTETSERPIGQMFANVPVISLVDIDRQRSLGCQSTATTAEAFLLKMMRDYPRIHSTMLKYAETELLQYLRNGPRCMSAQTSCSVSSSAVCSLIRSISSPISPSKIETAICNLLAESFSRGLKRKFAWSANELSFRNTEPNR